MKYFFADWIKPKHVNQIHPLYEDVTREAEHSAQTDDSHHGDDPM